MVSKKYMFIYLFLAIAPMVLLGIVYPSLPAEIVLRNPGTPNEGYGSKLNLWLLPAINVIIALMGICSPTLSRKNLMNVGQKVGEKILVLVMVIFNIVIIIETLIAKNLMTVSAFGIALFVILMPIIVIFMIGIILRKSN